MNYDNQELIDMLAAEYVLGTLRGPARRRYDRLMLTSTRAREATWMWEQHLNKLASSIESVPVNEKVWQKINQRIESKHVVPLPKKTSKGLQAWSFVATAASIVLALLLFQPAKEPAITAEQVALFKSESNNPLWFIDVNNDTLTVKASQQLVPRDDKDYELWMILKGQEAPISLGLLPKSGRLELAKHGQFNPQEIAILAVSLEPLGGSPTGSPTEVLYTTELVIL